ncbi:pollen receptor-like kinase 1 [Andrographis paniculata]|uniref:pollen receptor-like kinase 1 n=1 Tax=Andrographis paniculata TaxID=175694 RepID=UPI0021E79954|nr:pollen receptor-like kinase 1 [Andrographis paniculata]
MTKENVKEITKKICGQNERRTTADADSYFNQLRKIIKKLPQNSRHAFTSASTSTASPLHLRHSPPLSAAYFRRRAPPPPPRPTMPPHLLLLLLLLLNNPFLLFPSSADDSEAQILLKFSSSLSNAAALSGWNASSSPPCDGVADGPSSWAGVLCDRGRVWGIKLENMGLAGGIDMDSLAKLESLRTVSFMGNNFGGEVPEFAKLSALKRVYLSYNGFSGEIGDQNFAGMASLKKLFLSANRISGPIPTGLAELPRLSELMLDRNQFEGEIPNFPLENLVAFNASDNKLGGEIPKTLRRFHASSFSGNKDLCGTPLPCCAKHGPKQSVAAIIVAGVLVAAATAALVAVVVILLRRKKNPSGPPAGSPAPAAKIRQINTPTRDVEEGQTSPLKRPSNAAPPQPPPSEPAKPAVKLTFVRDDGVRFDMAELLKASAEVLGGGAFGSTYKAALSRPERFMVVKRFKHMSNVSRDEFTEHMRRLGQLTHGHVLPLVAFYYRKEEKLLVTEYAENFSLAVQLHGNRSRRIPPPDWPARLSILKGVAAALQYLYAALPSLTAPHGHLKSSNVLLDRNFRPLLTDYGLIPVVNQEVAPEHMISYKSPEYKDSRRICRKTDIWSFGILILETLTGRFPSNLLQPGSRNDVDLATWAESVLRRGGGGDGTEGLFDKEMEGAGNSVGEMMKLLKLGVNCCRADVDNRPDIVEVVRTIEEIKERDSL